MSFIGKIRNLTKLQLIILFVILLTIVSIIDLWMNPAHRKGLAGFGPPAKMTSYQAKDGSFSISYPENWTVIETPQGSHGDKEIVTVIIVAGHQIANITMARQSFVQGNIDEVVDWGQLRAASLYGYKSISLDPVTSNGYDGYLHEYSFSNQSAWSGMEFSHCQDLYLYENNTGYSLAFCSSEKDWPDLLSYYVEMQNSFSMKAISE
jgi:hypothetical protein